MLETVDNGFLEELASSAPTPGGGGASAYCAALAASLASMVGNLTIGKPKFADVEAEVIGAVSRLAILRSRLVELIEQDAMAFEPLAAAYKMPHDTDDQARDRNIAIQDGLADACEPPLEIMRCVIDVLHECSFLAHEGSRMAVSDAGASALMAKAALVSASLNVYINASSMEDEALAAHLRAKADSLIEEGSQMADETYGFVAELIGAHRMEQTT